MPSAASRSASKRAPITDAAFTVRLAGLVSRSMRASMAACTVAGTLMSATSAPTDVAAALAGQHAALDQLTHHLLGEKRVPGGPLGDDRRQLADRGVRTQQLIQQCCGVRISQWGKRYRLRAVHPRQRSLVFGAGGDQHHRRGARNDGEEVGQHRLADRIDPVRVLDDEQRRCGARQPRGVDQCGQPAPPRIRVDLGQRHLGVGDAQQIIQQQQILRVGIRHVARGPGSARPGRRGRRSRCRAQQPRSPHERGCRWRGIRRRPKRLRPRERPPAPRPPGPPGTCRCPAVPPRSPHHRGHRSCGPPWRRAPPSPSADRPGRRRRARPGHRAGRSPPVGARAPVRRPP